MRKIVKSVDLSGLPRYSTGKYNDVIKWDETVGMSINFVYDNVSGRVKILGYDKNTKYITIYIDGYTNKNGYSMNIQTFQSASFGNIFKTTIKTDAPWMMEYLLDLSDSEKYSIHSKSKIHVKCPKCGSVRKMSVGQLYDFGFSCRVCSDNISYPNKFMKNLLTQLNLDFINEVGSDNEGFEWVGNFRYDFYFCVNSKKYFIEMDGRYHDNDYMIKRDEIKNRLAYEHGVTMIRIDCRYKNDRFNFIKNNILNSELNGILDLKNQTIDWEKCDIDSQTNLVHRVCKLWDDGNNNIKQIAKILDISRSSVEKYLKIGEKYGFSNYTVKKSVEINIDNLKKRNTETMSKPLALYNDDNLIGVFKSCSELSNLSEQLLGVKLLCKGISRVCTGERGTYYGYLMVRISKEQYEQCKLEQIVPVY